MMLASAGAAGLTETIVQWAEPWSKVYAHSKPLSAGVLFLHLAPLVFAAGVAFAADRGTLRAARGTIDDRVRQLDDLSRVHPLVISGLILSFLSGVGMFLSDVETFMASTFFWVKLSCVALLLINGLMMTRTEKALAGSGTDTTLWARLRMLSILSAILWLTTTLAGVVLKEFA